MRLAIASFRSYVRPVTLQSFFPSKRHRRVLDVIMPGGSRFLDARDCLSACPAYRRCERGGPDGVVCTEGWQSAESSKENLDILAHVTNRFDHYNAGDQQLSADSRIVGQIRERIRQGREALVDDGSLDLEGGQLLKVHRSRERGRQAKLKKAAVLRATGKLACEACGFDFRAFYGSLVQRDYAECHHTKPLGRYASPYRTPLVELAVVCANCHVALHMDLAGVTVAKLRRATLATRTKARA